MNTKWTPIPGYEGTYEISRDGKVRNRDGHIIKPMMSKQGMRVELRQYGQRDRLLVSELVELTWGCSNEDC